MDDGMDYALARNMDTLGVVAGFLGAILSYTKFVIRITMMNSRHS